MIDYDLILRDRLEIIKTAYKKFNLEDNSYLSFSGGKDSTILHYLLDMAIPNNHIPRVFIDTGIEYNFIVDFVKDLASKDNRFIIIRPLKPIIKTLNDVGYPFKSKEHSYYVEQYKKHGFSKTVQRYLNPSLDRLRYGCPNVLKYQFDDNFVLKISNRCCYELKKKPIQEWQNDNKRYITITGMRKYEGGNRMNIQGCILTDNKGNLIKFHPLLVVTDEWEELFIKNNGINLCKLYESPFNFKRTGCKGCPYSLCLQDQLDLMEKYLPNEYRQCELIWKPIYEEYRRIGYRLSNLKVGLINGKK